VEEEAAKSGEILLLVDALLVEVEAAFAVLASAIDEPRTRHRTRRRRDIRPPNNLVAFIYLRSVRAALNLGEGVLESLVPDN
jgi:hypothetical protein